MAPMTAATRTSRGNPSPRHAAPPGGADGGRGEGVEGDPPRGPAGDREAEVELLPDPGQEQEEGGVEDESEEAEGDQPDGQTEELEDRLQVGVDGAEDEGQDEDVDEVRLVLPVEVGDHGHRDPQGDGVDDEARQLAHGPILQAASTRTITTSPP